MALSKPLLATINAFDSDLSQVIFFNVVGGNQVVANRLVVRDNLTNVVVYDQTQQSFRFEHIISPNSLVNGNYYNAVLTTFDSNGAESQASNSVQFYCFSTPTLTFTNFPVGNIIRNSSYSFDVEYNQAQGELLNIYQYKLYNQQQELLSTSGELFVNSPTPPPTSLSYTFRGFDDNGNYYIECIGTTLNKTTITSGVIPFTVNYENPNLFAIIGLENDYCNGRISITSNIVLIEGQSNPSPPIYIDDKEIDLRQNGSWVKWTDGFNISSNFTAEIWGRDFNEYKPIMLWQSKYDDEANPSYIYMNYMLGYETVNDTDMKAYFQFYCYDGSLYIPYYIYSNYIPIPSTDETIFIRLRRINGIFEVQIANMGVIL